MIDVGGPSMLRAAAKNSRTSRSSPTRPVRARAVEFTSTATPHLGTRKHLAGLAFDATAAYDAAIAGWFGAEDPFPEQLAIALRKVTDLSYGENPHQQAAYYRELGARRHLLSGIEQLGGKPLSYNNLGDLEGARRIAPELTAPRQYRQTRESVRRGARRFGRGRVGPRARGRPGVGVRVRGRAEPAGRRRAGRHDR